MADWFNYLPEEEESVVKTADSNESRLERKAQLDKAGVFECLQDPETFATILLLICLIMYGNDTFKLDPLVLFQNLKDDFGTELHEDNESKLQAILVALTTDFFFTDVTVFQNVCKTLTSGDPDIYENNFMAEPATAPEILWGIYEVALNTEDKVAGELPFSLLVDGYINSVLSKDVDDDSDIEDLGPTGSANIIAENVAKMKLQLRKIGIEDLPVFPKFEL